MTPERRIGASVNVLAAAVFGALLMAVPALYPSYDEAK